MTDLRYGKLTYELRGAIFEVRRQLRTGWPEKVYHQGLMEALHDRGIPAQYKPQKAVSYRGVEIHRFECDVIAWDLIILELKTLIQGSFSSAHQAQLLHYCKCWGKGLGLLVNFGPSRADIERYVWDEPVFAVREDYDAILPGMNKQDRADLERIRQAVITVGQEQGLGYPETIYRQMLAIEADYGNLLCRTGVEVPASWNGRLLTRYASDCIQFENSFLISVRSSLENPASYDFARIKTFLNCLGLKFGLVVNFGKRELQIHGVNPE